MARELREVWIYIPPMAPHNVVVKAEPFEGLPESFQQYVTRVSLLTPHDAAVLEAVDALTDALADAQRAMDNGEAYTASNHLLRTLYNLNRARRAANAGGEGR